MRVSWSIFEKIKSWRLSLQRLKNKAQEGKRGKKWRKEAQTKNYWKTRCSRHTFTILAITRAYELGFRWFKRPRKAKRKIYNFGFYHFWPGGSIRSVGARIRFGWSKLDFYESSNRSVLPRIRSVGWNCLLQVIFNASLSAIKSQVRSCASINS